jgi:hypothetical protein
MNDSGPRWVRASKSGFAHLDLGERSRQSLRVFGEHIIVTACRAHLAPTAEVVPADHQPRCSNCQRITRRS